jgi:hypothetical protein
MTQTQTPFQSQSDVSLYQEPDRTSIMAILSLVFGVGGCCLGVTSIPAILLGIFGLIGIARSKGRVGGTGFGIAGILIGLLTAALWGGLLGAGAFGMSAMQNEFGGPTEEYFLHLQADDFDSARAIMASPGADASDEEMLAFREAYMSTLGEFVSNSDGIMDLFGGYSNIAELIQPYNGRPGYIPMPMRFDSGWALVIFVMDQTGASGPVPLEYIVVDSQGNEYRMPMVSGGLPPLIDQDLDTDVDTEVDESEIPDAGETTPLPDDAPDPEDGP